MNRRKQEGQDRKRADRETALWPGVPQGRRVVFIRDGKRVGVRRTQRPARAAG
jgi:hypothetical protein